MQLAFVLAVPPNSKQPDLTKELLQVEKRVSKQTEKKIKFNKNLCKTGPITEQSNSLDCGGGAQSSNPGERCNGDGELSERRIVAFYNEAYTPL